MKSPKKFIPRLILIIPLLWLCGCTFKTSNKFTPDFNDRQKTVKDTINSSYHFEDITFEGAITSGTDGNHTTLTLSFINGKNIPAGNDEMKLLAKQLLVEVRATLKNPNQFDLYYVNFISRTGKGAITSSTSVGFIFSPDDLK